MRVQVWLVLLLRDFPCLCDWCENGDATSNPKERNGQTGGKLEMSRDEECGGPGESRTRNLFAGTFRVTIILQLGNLDCVKKLSRVEFQGWGGQTEFLGGVWEAGPKQGTRTTVSYYRMEAQSGKDRSGGRKDLIAVHGRHKLYAHRTRGELGTFRF
jgi:hypothetical protein